MIEPATHRIWYLYTFRFISEHYNNAVKYSRKNIVHDNIVSVQTHPILLHRYNSKMITNRDDDTHGPGSLQVYLARKKKVQGLVVVSNFTL